jgi:dTDP-4-amino-4,6-dideoxygalactose transaminase
VTQGAKVDEFERLLAARLGTSHIVTLNNCTSAIQLALRLAGVGPGTSVVSTPMTCTASNMPVLAQGADLIWADIDPHTGVIDPESVLKRIRPDTKAVIAVAWGGYPPALDELDALCSEYGVALIQDNAQAFGAEYHGRPVHEWGDFACYSFQAIKHLTTIDGGMLICRDADAYRRARLLRWYGIDRDDKRQDARIENDIPEFGYKWHMNDVAATIGIEQLKYIDDILARHRANAAYYNEEFGRRDLFRAQPAEHGDSGRTPAYWLYTVLVDDPHGFRQHMADRGIQVSPAHKRNDKHSCFADAVGCPLPGVDEFSAHEMCVPVGWWVSDDDRRQIMNAIEEWDYVEEAVSER